MEVELHPPVQSIWRESSPIDSTISDIRLAHRRAGNKLFRYIISIEVFLKTSATVDSLGCEFGMIKAASALEKVDGAIEGFLGDKAGAFVLHLWQNICLCGDHGG